MYETWELFEDTRESLCMPVECGVWNKFNYSTWQELSGRCIIVRNKCCCHL